jgi:hypothetical protein
MALKIIDYIKDYRHIQNKEIFHAQINMLTFISNKES